MLKPLLPRLPGSRKPVAPKPKPKPKPKPAQKPKKQGY